ncbi:MAG: hypothetical protein ABEI07_01175 [Candidatus Nanohaloarchaea archaeon]
MNLGILISTTALFVSALNIMLFLSILSRITSVAESPRAWNLLTVGMGLVVIHFSLQVFQMVNPSFDFLTMRMISVSASLFGFWFLFAGVYRVWEVLYR